MQDLMIQGMRETPIQRVLRHRQSREYFKGDGWTANAEEAACFSDSLEAVKACVQHGLTDVELALRVQGGASDVFCIPIR